MMRINFVAFTFLKSVFKTFFTVPQIIFKIIKNGRILIKCKKKETLEI